MTILLTGGTGFIGSHTASVLVEAGHNVVLLDNFSNSSPDVADRLARITGERVVLVKGDVRDTPLVRDCLEQYACTSVIHFAGLKAVGESASRPLDYYASNVQGTISLVQAMNMTAVRSLVFSSSATVYGVSQYLPYDEKHPTAAINPYGRTKLHVEEMLKDLCDSDPSWRIACLRYFNPVGAHPSGLIGEDPQGIPNNLMPFIAKVASGVLPEVNVFGTDYETPDGTGIRDYIHVMDLAEGHLAAVAYLERNAGWQAINLGTGRGYSVLEVLRAFERTCMRTLPWVAASRRPGDVPTSYANASKAAELLGWRAHRDLDDMCASTWRWQCNVAGKAT
ncbi:UDP-glucose 4-epimerase GalE [Caenimonas terrae]|uniref:UDP-glucose 4-epimerase n=1 Tax=Caenimonas terrae TaxID=696074 RepID=A0ABW0NCI5_9BURK